VSPGGRDQYVIARIITNEVRELDEAIPVRRRWERHTIRLLPLHFVKDRNDTRNRAGLEGNNPPTLEESSTWKEREGEYNITIEARASPQA